MFPTIHNFDASDLQSQGYGALSDVISASVTEELNGSFTLEMKYPLKGVHSEYLIPSNIIMCKPSHNQPIQPFRINQVKRSFANSIMVYANHISYDLSGYLYRPARTYSSLSAVISALNSASWSTGSAVYNQFHFDTDMTSSATFKMEGIQSVRSWMGGHEGSILDTYGGEWEYDNFNVFLKSRRGEDTGIRISYGKNLAEYEKQRNNDEYSHVCAYWKKSDVLVYGDLVATGLSCTFRGMYVDATKDFENEPTTNQLNLVASAYITQLQMDTQNITVTPAQIGQVIGLGDSVLICYDGVIQTRVIKTVWDAIAGVYKQLVLGSKTASITDTIKSLSPSSPVVYDFILEEGTTNGWTWRKWNSGKYECWMRDSSKKGTIDQAWGSFYYGTVSAYTYPITFVGDYPVVNITVQANNGGAWAVPNYADYSFTSTGTIYLYRPTTTTNMAMTINIYAVGRWKI